MAQNELNIITGPTRTLEEKLKNIVAGQKGIKIFVSGYSSASEVVGIDATGKKIKKFYDYAPSLADILETTAHQLGGNVAYITSPTTAKGSIDAVATCAGIKYGQGAILFTAEKFMKYVNPDELELTDAQKNIFRSIPKFAFAAVEDYSEISAKVCDVMIICGGRTVALQDFINAVHHGKPVIILESAALPSASDFERDMQGKALHPKNASSFLVEKIGAFVEGRNSVLDTFPDMGLSADFMKKHEQQLAQIVNQRVVSYDPADGKSITRAAHAIAALANSAATTNAPVFKENSKTFRPRP